MYKKTFILLCLLFLVNLTSTAQEQRWTLKPMVGITLSSLVGGSNTPGEYSPKLGWGCGAEVEYRLSDRWDLSLGVLFTNRQTKSETTVGYYDGSTYIVSEGKYSTVFNQTDFPIMLHLQLTRGLKAGIGIQPTLLLSAKQEDLQAKGTSVDIKNKCRTLGMDIPVGAAYDFDNIEFGLHYSFGLFNAIHGSDTQSRCLMLTLGYRFGF